MMRRQWWSKQMGLRILTAIALSLYLALSFRVGFLLVQQKDHDNQQHTFSSSSSSSAAATTTTTASRPLETDDSSINMPTGTGNKGNASSTIVEPNVVESSSNNNSTAAFLLGRFRPCHSPIMGSLQQNNNNAIINKKPVRIRILLFEHKVHHITFRKGPTSHIGDEVLNICMDGFERSPHFDLVNATIVPDFTLASTSSENNNPPFVIKEDEDIVWVVDMRRTIIKGTSYTIGKQLVVAANATLQYQKQRALADPSNFKMPSLKVVLMDYRDKITERRLCTKGMQKLISLLGVGNVRSVVRQIVRGREFVHDDSNVSSSSNNNKTNKTGFVNPGHVWDSQEDNACFGFPTLHVPYTVRSDYVEAIQQEYPKYLLKNVSTSLSLSSSPIINHATASIRSVVETERPMDVAHFWPVIEHENCAQLRNAVTKTILALNGTTITTNKNGKHHYLINTFGDFVSKGTGIGRTTVSSSYVQALLTTKIIVVAQRDEWEDHYRLFEAIIGGALVLSDPMWSLPDGLVDGESIVIYQSLDHLQELILYYLDPQHADERLAIAQRGWTVAMTRHRSYHWMEALFFGRPLTT